MSSLTKGQIAAAVNWWGHVVVCPKHDNGDSSDVGGMAAMLAFLGVKPVSIEQVEVFKTELAKTLREQDYLAQWGLSCDYGPCDALAEAMEKAGIPTSNAPWKTCMVFRDGAVKVAYGYGKPYEVIFTAETKEE